DSTNVLHAGTCVITPIGLDHTEWLGDTLSDIAYAKAGIIHPGATVVTAAQPEEAARALLERCADVGATIAREGSEYGVLRRAVAVGGQMLTLQGLGGEYDEVFLPLHGPHQAQNAAVALAATEAFLGAGAGGKALDAEVVREGCPGVTSPGPPARGRAAPPTLAAAAPHPRGSAATGSSRTVAFSHPRHRTGAGRGE